MANTTSTETKATKRAIRYFTTAPGADPETQMRNGSFMRQSLFGVSWFANGDFMGMTEHTPESLLTAGHTEIPHEMTKLLPACCR
jgi:hypothetical protein